MKCEKTVLLVAFCVLDVRLKGRACQLPAKGIAV